MPVDEHHIEYALDKAGCSGALITSWIPTALEYGLLRLLPTLRRNLRREPVRLHLRTLRRHILPDICRSIHLAIGTWPSVLLAHDEFFRRIDRLAAKHIDERTAMVVGREFGCLHSFRSAAQLDVRRLYHLPTTHHAALKRILDHEAAVYPGVCKSTFDPAEFESERLNSKLEEITLADRIMCPSAFVRSTLIEAGVQESKITLVPFGCEQSWIEEKRRPSKGVFLFVGNISARKGAHRLLKAWKELGAYQTHRLLLVGDMHLSPAFLRDYKGVYEHVPRLPREDLRDLYLAADALVLPALAEGFALVILEALSCGTAVLASRNSGAEGFLTDGVDGCLFDAQDDTALKQKLEWALSHPRELEQLGHKGRATAGIQSWRVFEKQVMSAFHQTFTGVS